MIVPVVLMALTGISITGVTLRWCCSHRQKTSWKEERKEPLLATPVPLPRIKTDVFIERSIAMDVPLMETCSGCGAWIDPSLAAIANGLCVVCSYQTIPSLEIDIDENISENDETSNDKDSDKPILTDEDTTADIESPKDVEIQIEESNFEDEMEDISTTSQDMVIPISQDNNCNEGDEDVEIAEEALALVQDMWDIAYQAHLGVGDDPTADIFVEMALDLDATAEAIKKEPHLLSESFHFLSLSLASLMELVPEAWVAHVEATELKFEALQFRYHSKLTVENCLDLATHLYELVECAQEFGVDPAVASSLMDGLEELVEAIEETPCELVSWLAYLAATVKLLKSYQRDFEQAEMWDTVVECERNLEPLEMHCWEIYSPC
ncbi:hypothetical protein THRCLA_10790 [Thraustotheca clavata]|uniref:Uncharacterized protein n=1 Tax=Thraustotheca clavata TaxID=74557 RepID=A0A1V9YHB8_9STRA|nr:hypothetical protein THRCLA_10790 [Thraustotheca clavata]